MKSVVLLCFVVCWLLTPSVCAIRLFDGAGVTPRPRIGTGLEALFGYNQTCPWVNVMKCAPAFVVTTLTGGFVSAQSVALTSTGLPANMTTSWMATTTVLSGLDGHYDGGMYDLVFSGSGNVSVSGDVVDSVWSTNGTLSFSVNPQRVGIRIVLWNVSSANPITTITLWCRATHAAATTRWNPSWLSLITKFSVVRFTQWQQESYSSYIVPKPTDWSGRPSNVSFTQVQPTGVSHEDIAALLVDAQIDAVLSVPQAATADYISGMVQLYLATGRKLYLVDSFQNGYLSVPTRRVDRLIQISNVARPIVGPNSSDRMEIVLAMDLFSDEFSPYFNPTSPRYNISFVNALDAVAYTGELTVAAELWSSQTPNPYFTSIAPFMNDVYRLTYERLLREELTMVDYVGRWAQLNVSVYLLDAGILMATDMHGQRFANASSPEGQLQIAVERILWNYELSNAAALRTLWIMLLERYRRLGVKMIVAGRLVAKGIECNFADTQFKLANRYQCFYRGLTRFLDTAESANKLQGVLAWIANTNATEIAMTVDAPAPPGQYSCNGTCMWGSCGGDGACVCHNGYTGAQCDTFDETLLPNRCSPSDYGINIAGVADWDTSWMWTNYMHYARNWIHQPTDGAMWSFPASTPSPPLDNNGYPLRLEPGRSVSTFLRRDTYQYLVGKFHFLFEGDGTIHFGMDTWVVQYVRIGYIIVETRPLRQLNNGLWFQIRRTNPDNPVRNIVVIPDSQFATYRGQIFHPLFLHHLKRFRVMRFMGPQHVQGDIVYALNFTRSWSDRTPTTYYSQTAGRDGLSIEHIVSLCNQLHTRPWINIPYNAKDDYVTNLTAYLKAKLNPRLTPIVEYSNEVWASDLYAGFYAQNMAIQLGLDSGAWVVRSRACYNQYRARQIWRIMRNAGLNITSVLGAQAVYTGPLSTALECANSTEARLEIDAVAVAPYLDVTLQTPDGLLTADAAFNTALTQINASVGSITSHFQVLAQYNMTNTKVFCYEAGPSMRGGINSDKTLLDFGYSLHRDPRMHGVVHAYFNGLRNARSSLNMYFIGPASPWSVYGSYGIREYENQDPATTPKVSGYEAYAAQHATCTPTPDPVGCPQNCSGHGFCLENNKCECYFAYRGTTCAESWTIPDLQYCNRHLCPLSGGTCSPTASDGAFRIYTCTGCSSNYTGWMCQYPVCPGNCSFQGTCVAPMKCLCFRGHMGANCEISCGCNGHGNCTSNGSCTCDTGYRFDGVQCVPSCSCASCQGPNLCACAQPCLYGACRNGTCVCWAGFGGPLCNVLAGNKSSNSASVMGINAAGFPDWSTSNPMLNLMWRSRHWIVRPANVHAPGNVWSLNEPLNLTSDGYPAELPFDRVATTFVTRDTGTVIPGGVYTMMWDGRGILSVGFDAVAIPSSRASNLMLVQYTPTIQLDNGFMITIEATDPSNPIRNIRVYSPDAPDDSIAKSMVFNPLFLADIAPFRVVRFMDWAALGAVHPEAPMGSYVRDWSKRNSLNACSMNTGYGVSEEIMISLANWLNVEPWFSIPHDADDTYVRNFALLLYHRLRPDVGIQIEHSNEVWNSLFESYKYAAVRGRRQFPNITDDFEAAIAWHGYRSQAIFSIFIDVFGPIQRSRLRFKLGTFALSTTVTRALLSFVTIRPVFVSSTGYFCDEHFYGGAAAAASKTVDQLIAECSAASTVNDTYMVRQFTLTQTYRDVYLDLYESGPGLVEMAAITSGRTAPGVADTFRQFHLDNRIYGIVMNFFTTQRRLGVLQFNYFTSAAGSSIYGNFGIKESTTQSCGSSPKCRAVMDWMALNQDPSYRTVNWGLADFGYNNVVQSVFAARPTQADIDLLLANLLRSMNLTNGSIVAIIGETSNTTASSTTSSTAARRHMQAQSGTIVYFVVTVPQASTTNASAASANLSSVIPQVASSTLSANVTTSVVQSSSVITPTSALPASLLPPATATPTPVKPAPATPTPVTPTPVTPTPATAVPGATAAPVTPQPTVPTSPNPATPTPSTTNSALSTSPANTSVNMWIGVGVGLGGLVAVGVLIAFLVYYCKCCRSTAQKEVPAPPMKEVAAPPRSPSRSVEVRPENPVRRKEYGN